MLRSLPVQVRLLLVLAAAGGAQRGAVRQFSSPLLLLAEKTGTLRSLPVQVNTTVWEKRTKMSNTIEAGTIVGGPVNNDTVNMAQVQTSRKGFCSVRHGLALILHLCNLSISTQQMNMSIALPVMVNNTALPSSPNASTERPPIDSQDNWNETLNESKAVAAVYDWSPEIQGIILSSLNYGSFLAPIPSSYMAEVFGTRYLSGTCMFITSVLALFTPLAADTGVTVLIVLRVIQGIVQVALLTSQYSIWARWAPPQERSQLITIAIAGSVLGCFIIFLVGGYLCQTIGWPYVFYIFGLLADFLLSRKILRLNTIRKLFTAIGVLLPAVLFTSVFWVRSSFSTTIAFLTISSAIKSFAQSGALVNFMDIAPR
ncbi:hypothetical protein MJG53_017557 [Ovis ammon polii x Ovis aries]|uniref:Uncharacterized protein n=1 Tax=Ovis ammon polii x Ovis aries TaxID=2918886 RepID=A0ACB9U8J1_9CETA|nr:hypothetical protein MJG53_017557 [Ovis ammon polii x Ovis aries]